MPLSPCFAVLSSRTYGPCLTAVLQVRSGHTYRTGVLIEEGWYTVSNQKQQDSESPTDDSISEVWSGQTERPEVNTRWALTAVPHSGEQPTDEQVAGQLTGSPGWYHITLVLGIPGLAAYKHQPISPDLQTRASPCFAYLRVQVRSRLPLLKIRKIQKMA